MARIPTYQKDIYISDLDRIIGTDGDTNELVTKNFFLGDIAEYVIDKFIDPDAVSFTIPVLRDTQDTLGSNATRITGSIMSQDINPDGTLITIAGKLQVDKEAKIKGKLTEGVAESGQLILNSSLNATGITIKAPVHADLPASYIMELPNDIGVAGSQLTTDGIGKVYWADPEDDDLTVTGDLGTGTIDLDTQSLNIIGGTNVSTTMLDQTLTISAAGFVTGSGTPYKLALWDQTENLTDSLISQGAPSAGSLVEINSPQVVIGTGNATVYNQKLIGEGIDALNESLITSATNVVLGEGSYGGVQGRKYYQDNTVMLDRVLRLGSAQVPENSIYNTIPTIHMGDPAWVRSTAFINYPGIQGFFPTISSGSTLYSSRFLYASSINVPNDGFNGTHADGARYQMMFDPQFGTASGGTGLGDVFGTESQANCSAGMVEYRTASQNYDYSTGAQSAPGSQGIFTFDARYDNNNYTAIGGTSLFLLKSGYGERKFEIKQNAGGSTNPGAALIFGKGAASTAINSVAMGSSVTASGNQSFAIGNGTTASGANSMASGLNTTASASQSVALGNGNTAGAVNSFAAGLNNTVTGTAAQALGNNNTVTGNNSFSAGQENTASGLRSVALGYDSTASGNNSVAIGYSNNISTANGIAIGLNNIDNTNGNDPNFMFGQGNSVAFPGSEGNVLLGRDNRVDSTVYGDMEHNILIGRYLLGLNAKDNGRKSSLVGAADACVVIGTNNTFPSQTTYPTSVVIAAGQAGDGLGQEYNAIEITEKVTSTSTPSYIIIGDGIKNLTDDAAAASAGVPIRGIYRTGSDLRIRMGSGGLPPVPNATLTPTNITATAGSNFWLTASNIGDLGKISWSGGNGTFTLKLPPASGTTNRMIRFITDGTFGNGAGDKVLLSARTGDTIDGVADFEISKAYEGVAIWSDGSEWYIIQAKAH